MQNILLMSYTNASIPWPLCTQRIYRKRDKITNTKRIVYHLIMGYVFEVKSSVHFYNL